MGIQDRDNAGVDLTATGDVAVLQPTGETTLTTVLENAGGSVDVAIQVREKGGTWRTYHTFSGTSSIQDSRELSAAEVRVRITAAATSGTGDFYVAAGG